MMLYIPTYLHTRIPINLHTYTLTYLYTYTPIHLHTYTLTYLYTYIPNTCIPIHLHTYTLTHLYTYIPIHLHTHTYIAVVNDVRDDAVTARETRDSGPGTGAGGSVQRAQWRRLCRVHYWSVSFFFPFSFFPPFHLFFSDVILRFQFPFSSPM